MRKIHSVSVRALAEFAFEKAVEIREDDTPQTLQRRVMEEAEWIILPRAIDLIAAGRVRIEGRRTRILDE